MTAAAEQEAPRRLTPTERLHAVTMQALTHAPRSGNDSVEIGQEARTKEWYVKSLSVYRGGEEGWLPWLERAAEMARAIYVMLPAPSENGGSE